MSDHIHDMLPVKFWDGKCIEWVCGECPHRERDKDYQALKDLEKRFLANEIDNQEYFRLHSKHLKGLLA